MWINRVGQERSRGNPRNVELLQIVNIVSLESDKRVSKFSGEKAVADSVATQVGHEGDEIVVEVFC